MYLHGFQLIKLPAVSWGAPQREVGELRTKVDLLRNAIQCISDCLLSPYCSVF